MQSCRSRAITSGIIPKDYIQYKRWHNRWNNNVLPKNPTTSCFILLSRNTQLNTIITNRWTTSITKNEHNDKINKTHQIIKRKDEMTPNTLALAQALVQSKHDSKTNKMKERLNQRRALSKAITLIESHSLDHIHQGDLLLNYLIETRKLNNENTDGERLKDSFRIGIAGAPGAGKSSFIEKFGIFLLENHLAAEKDGYIGNKITCHYPSNLAALCIDPSSTLTGGSILGDKTRMAELSRHPKAFVRPSPSRGDLGGVSLHTNDAITLCEAAGYDFVMVETVGIGQSEVSVSQVVDMLILIVAPGGGDGLQGVKKGIMEVADLLIVNKADGDLLPVARNTAADYIGATHFLRSRVEGWSTPPVLLASAKTGDGFNEVWETICKYRQIMTDNNELGRRKAKQARYWMWKHVQDLITSRVKSDDRIGTMAEEVENALDQGILSPRVAASNILQFLHLSLNGGNSKD